MGTTAPQRGSMTRGPLPAEVYWRRRAAVLGTVFLVIIALVRMFDGGADPKATARTTSSNVRTDVVPPNVGAPETSGKGVKTPAVAPSTPASLPVAPVTSLPVPTGRCSDDDVQVSAQVTKPEAMRSVWIGLTIKTGVATACLWQLSAKTLQVQVTSGADRIWSTLDCRKAVPNKLLTLRRDQPVTFGVKWSSRRSDADCSDHTMWAKPGYYHVQAAALGGEPVDVQFRLSKPSPAPKPSASAKPSASPSTKPGTSQPNPSPKGTRSEPTGKPTVFD